MQYAMLLWPHANARYQNESARLARCELELSLRKIHLEHEILPESAFPLPGLRFEIPRALAAEEVSVLSRQSLLYGLFESRPDGSLFPVAGRAEVSIGADLPAILKYKGKTNEQFTQLLINLAFLSGNLPENPAFLDPMCSRGTSVFVAANRGWDATGSDIDKADLCEAENFLKRYLEYHRLKYRLRSGSLTLAEKKSARFAEFCLSDQRLRFALLDARRVREAFGKKKFHILASDLPYGVQHSGLSLDSLLLDALPAWREVLAPGGAVALSFNAQTLPLARVRALLEQAGFLVMREGPYDSLSHWVEQSVTRDVAVGVVPL
ncbi:MAG TPA: hypothetical protein IAB02_03390 [Candidatus Pullichristensenella excrementigallinarum]|uniref:Uncharacterized protein n=1 Tax=Candidatus Pullichristensenella excrementigallinarum TaxID=2840907 RepID=A0A9D1ICZ5_9FIRM|nr:hypothetical protein [Candidatus Pullichristensenella excrementigallinarum]